MKTFKVNSIHEEKNATHNVTISNQTVLDNVKEMFGDKALAVVKLAVELGQNFYSIDKYCQYVAVTRYGNPEGLSMTLSTFHGNVDNALDEHLRLTGKDWPKADVDKYSRLAHEIINDKDLRPATIEVVPLFL